ncbi:protein FAM184A-like [Haliotis asinina]|uniref:protein FAM184A-like n=1 Tax=Haliotis asinina TaxID=109174 RepID=UPI0035327122
MDVFKAVFVCLCGVKLTCSSTTTVDDNDIVSHVQMMQNTLSYVLSQLQLTQAEQKSTSDELRVVRSELKMAEDTIRNMTRQLQNVLAEQNATLRKHKATLDELTEDKIKRATTESSLDAVQTLVKNLQIEHEKTINDLDALKSQLGASHDSQVRLETEFSILHTDLQSVEDDLAVAKYLSSQQKANINAITTDLNNLQTDMANVKSAGLDSLLSQVNTSKLDALSADVMTTANRVTILEWNLHKANNDVLAMNSDVGKLASNVTEFQASVSSEVSKIKTSLLGDRNRESLQHDIYRKLNSTSDVLGNMEHAVASLETELLLSRHGISDLNQTLQTLMHNVSNMTGSGARHVAFEVRLQKEIHSVQMGGKLIFDTLLYNNGAGYEASSGIFTAPVSGSYIFWAQVMLDQVESYLEIYIVQNGHIKGKGYAETSKETVYGVVAITTVMHLSAGDEVWFEKWKGSQNIYGNLYSGFGAALVSA